MYPLLSLALASFLCVPIARRDDPLPAPAGPLVVQTVDSLTLKDTARKKDLLCKVYFPQTGGPYPVILFSHGFGGNQEAFGTVSRHWASRGYVVIHPSHGDLAGRRRASGKEAPLLQGSPGGLLGGLYDPQKIENRVADLVLILDSLGTLPQPVPELAGKIDPKRIGVAGHSFGAYTAMLIGGVTGDLGREKARSLADPRGRCILPISAQGTGQQGLTEKSWDALRIPMMTITGTRDQGVGGQGVEWKKEPFRYSPEGDKYLVVIEGANHASFGGGLGARGSATVEIVKMSSTWFWDAYLRGSEEARRYLQSDQMTRNAGSRFTFQWK